MLTTATSLTHQPSALLQRPLFLTYTFTVHPSLGLTAAVPWYLPIRDYCDTLSHQLHHSSAISVTTTIEQHEQEHRHCYDLGLLA